MALSSDTIEILTRLKAGGYLEGPRSVAEIGAQQLANSFLQRERLLALAQVFEISAPCPLPEPIPTEKAHGELEHLRPEAPAARDFWVWLGFSYAAVDVVGGPDSLWLDLNYDPAPTAARGKFQLVTNFGTTEHVANQLNAFKVIHDLTMPGGVMLHHLPMQGMLNHGLINYNPKFFWMLARSNGYRTLYMNVAGDTTYYVLPENASSFISDFEPSILERRDSYRMADMDIVAVLQKQFDTPYVAPLDVPTGTATRNPVLQQRYWSVFTPNAFDHLPPGVALKKGDP
jgi:hypothetical protein